jgi:hypothetical protein
MNSAAMAGETPVRYSSSQSSISFLRASRRRRRASLTTRRITSTVIRASESTASQIESHQMKP